MMRIQEFKKRKFLPLLDRNNVRILLILLLLGIAPRYLISKNLNMSISWF